jgi:seryl-tRNA synthetase
MLDIDFIRTNRDAVAQAIVDKAMNLDLDRLIDLDEQRRSLITKRDAILAERNQLAIEQAKVRGPAIKADLAAIEPKLVIIQAEFDELMMLVPQIPAADAPRGDESQSVELKRVGEPTTFDFEPRDHLTLGKLLDVIDTDRGAAISGYRGYFLKNEAALMHHGLMQVGLQIMRTHGFTVMVPPTIVRERALVGSGHFPFGKSEIYQIANPSRLADGSEQKDAQYLVGTAEPSLLAYWADQVLDAASLPVKACGISQSYRSEVGSYGKDTKGIYRIHEFMKVEQVVLVEADEHAQQRAFDEMLAIAEELLASLEVPYRVIDTTTEDMGAGKIRMYDIETWMPSRQAYGETHSCSMLGDWQARRLNIKYKTPDGKKYFVYTLNNTVIASPRILIALLENHQQADGSVKIPAALQPYVGASTIEPKS